MLERSWFYFLIAVLVVFRLSIMVATEEGPFSIFAKLRGVSFLRQENWLGRGIRCPYCVSFWFGFLVALWLPLPMSVLDYIFVSLALSGGAILVVRLGN